MMYIFMTNISFLEGKKSPKVSLSEGNFSQTSAFAAKKNQHVVGGL
jgi:threonine dehydratase